MASFQKCPSQVKEGKVVLITGASSGIGRVCALHLASRGYRVYGTSRHAPPLDSTVSSNGSLQMMQMDVNDDVSVERGVEAILAREGRLDVVVNNAGFGIGGAVEETSLAEAKAQFETNFFGVFRICKAVLPIMRKQGSGYIVNISSLGGRVGLPFVALYHASKFAVEGFTESLRLEVKPFGIRVVLIEPSDMRTDFTARRYRVAGAGPDSAYARLRDTVLQVIASDEMKGSDPKIVGPLLERILNDPSPRLRYTVGNRFQRLAVALKPLVPAALFEWALLKQYKMY